MNNEYIIVNKTTIEKRIEELKKDGKIMWWLERDTLQQIISQSTPLIPEIEKAFNVGVNSQFEVQEKNLTNKEDIRGYHQKKLINISNLKLDI